MPRLGTSSRESLLVVIASTFSRCRALRKKHVLILVLLTMCSGDPLGQHANLGVNMHSSVSEMQTLWYNL